MNSSKYIPRLALAALMITAAAIPAAAQGKSGDKGKAKVATAVAKNDDKPKTVTSNGEVAKAVKKNDVNVAKAAEKSEANRAKAAAKATKRVTSTQAITVTREVLVANGYQVVQVVPSGTSQIIYYRRGNMGRGKGLGPVEKIVVVPAGQIVSFQSVPQPLLATILRRLGM